MGGKDSIVVAADANVDAAVEGVAVSAFGFQGQKCSACSRAIVDASIYDEFVDKLKDRVAKMTVGDPEQQPAITWDRSSTRRRSNRFLSTSRSAKRKAALIAGGNRVGSKGYFLEPTVIADVEPHARISQEEIFGPVLAIIKAKIFDRRDGDRQQYGVRIDRLALHQRRAKIERASEDFFVGNLYFNRKSTGAYVGVHPFGGFNMSGTDSKAGGRDYLLLFMQAKSMSRKIS